MKRDEILALVAEAARAPSAHNVQPARWRIGADYIQLWYDTKRQLPVGDPANKDLEISLGAAWEAMRIALAARGVALEQPTSFDERRGDVRAFMSAKQSPAPEKRDLRDALLTRTTWRGRFPAATAAGVERLKAIVESEQQLRWTTDPDAVRRLATLHDACTWEFLQEPEFQAELYHWMRLNPHHPARRRDGLDAAGMNIHGAAQYVADWVMRPVVFRRLQRAGFARFLVTEAAQVRSACAILVLLAGAQERWFDAGQRFMRLWLRLEQAGFALCPMSSTSDSAHGQAALREAVAIDPNNRIMNVWRVGPAPRSRPRSARLPAEELLLD